jgi:hypothetical protein
MRKIGWSMLGVASLGALLVAVWAGAALIGGKADAAAASTAKMAATDAGASDDGKAAASPKEPAPKGPAVAVQGPADITFVEDDDTKPATGKAATNPFGDPGTGVQRKDAVPGYVELSNGLKIPGYIYTTRAKRLKIFNLKRELYEYVPVPALKSIQSTVEWERMDKEWRFKEAGNPEKVYSGREYPVRKVMYTLTLRNDHEIAGHILGQPVYVEHGGKIDPFILHDRDKGAMGATLDTLKYIKSVVFGPEAYNLAVEELKAKAEAAAKKAEQGARKGAPVAPPAPAK